jgi:hypothetical protein
VLTTTDKKTARINEFSMLSVLHAKLKRINLMKNSADKFCEMAADLEKIVDTCPTGPMQAKSCDQARKAYTIAANNCAQYRLTTFEEKYPGELDKLEASSANTTTLPYAR